MERSSEPNEFTDEQEQIEISSAEYNRPKAESYGDYLEYEEGRIVGTQERQSLLDSHVRDTRALYHHQRSERELEEYHVYWDNITTDQITTLKISIERATNEEELQLFLTANKQFLVQHLGGGHGRYVIPKPQLGAELIPDYLIAEMSSLGIEWHGVELEPSSVAYFTASGQPRYNLTHAIQQVIEWRAWIGSNIAYARTPKSDNGLGLVGITSNLPATILIGRRNPDIPPNFNSFRQQIKYTQNIEIHTYDWLIEQSEHRASLLGR